MEEPVVTSNDDLSQPSTIANRESVVHDKNPTEPQSVDEQHFAGDAEPTVVTPMPRETSANVEDLRETASTQRIKVREYFDPRQVINDDPSLSGSRRSAKLDVGPTIHPMEPLPSESTAQAPLPLNSDNELTPERPISTRVSRNRQSFARVKIDQQDELHAPVKDEEFPWLEKSDEEFPAKNVLELKRRLQSAASLQPGDIPAGQSQSRDESSTRRPEDDDDAPLQSNRMRKRLRFRAIPNEAGKSLVADSLAATKTPSAEYVDINSESRQETTSELTDPSIVFKPTASTGRSPVYGQTSMVKWRPLKLDTDLATTKARIEARTAAMTTELREELREPAVIAAAAPVDTITGSMFSLPTIKLKYSSEGKPQLSLEEVEAKSSSATAVQRPEVRGSLWDNATAPSIDGYSGSIDGYSAAGTDKSHQPLAAPLPPSGESVEQTSFDSPMELFHRRRGHSTTTAASNQIDSTDSLMPPIDAIPTNGINGESSRLTPRRSVTGDEAAVSMRAALSNGPIERLAVLFGVRTSTAATILGTIGVTFLVGGLWLVRFVARSSTK